MEQQYYNTGRTQNVKKEMKFDFSNPKIFAIPKICKK